VDKRGKYTVHVGPKTFPNFHKPFIFIFFNNLLEVVDIFRQHFSEVLPTFFRQYFSGVFATFFHQYFSGVFATIFSSTFFGSVTNNFRQHFQEV
jgi:hypothetical protein